MLHSQGTCRPQVYILIWSRKDILAWAQNHGSFFEWEVASKVSRQGRELQRIARAASVASVYQSDVVRLAAVNFSATPLMTSKSSSLMLVECCRRMFSMQSLSQPAGIKDEMLTFKASANRSRTAIPGLGMIPFSMRQTC